MKSRDNWEKAKRAAFDRDEGMCQMCGRPAVDVHHRLPRKMGGRKDPEVNFGLANLVCLCRKDHDWCHRNPEAAYKTGFLLRTGQDPSGVPWRAPGREYEF